MLSHTKIYSIVMLSVIAVTAGSIACAQDENSASGNNGAAIPSPALNPQDQQKSLNYWTPERMQNAKPVDMNVNGVAPAGMPGAGPGGEVHPGLPVPPEGAGAAQPSMEDRDSER